MRRTLAIIGAGGHGRVVADIARLNGYDIHFFDDDKSNKLSSGTVDEALEHRNMAFIVAIGDNETRMHITNRISDLGLQLATLIHPRACIASDAAIGPGTVVMANAVVNSGAAIGKGCIINTSAVVEHDCRIDDFSHISVNSTVAGTVSIGRLCFIGAGATIINNISISDSVIIGAGAVVVEDIMERSTYIGVPARNIRNHFRGGRHRTYRLLAMPSPLCSMR